MVESESEMRRMVVGLAQGRDQSGWVWEQCWGALAGSRGQRWVQYGVPDWSRNRIKMGWLPQRPKFWLPLEASFLKPMVEL